jgi:hypothetical protein
MKKLAIFIMITVLGIVMFFSTSIYKTITSSIKPSSKVTITRTMETRSMDAVRTVKSIDIDKTIDKTLDYGTRIVGLIGGIAGLGLTANHTNKRRKAKKTK